MGREVRILRNDSKRVLPVRSESCCIIFSRAKSEQSVPYVNYQNLAERYVLLELPVKESAHYCMVERSAKAEHRDKALFRLPYSKTELPMRKSFFSSSAHVRADECSEFVPICV